MDLAAAMALAASLWFSLPHGDSAWDLLETVAAFAFTEPMNTGGTVTGVPLQVGSEASSWTQATFRVGNADVTDPATGGRPLIYPDLSITGRVQLKGAAHELQAGAPGPVVTLVPPAGGTTRSLGVTWNREVTMAASPSPLNANGSSATDPIARLNALGRVQASAGGPLAAHGRIFISGAGTWSSHNERGETFTLPGNVLSFTAHPSIDIKDRHADATAWIQQTKTPFAARALLRDRNAAATQWYGGLAGTWRSGVKRVVDVSGALASTHAAPESNANPARGTVERLVDDPIETLVSSTGGGQSRSSIAATFATDTARVRVKGGSSVSHARMHLKPFGTGLIGETLYGMPARAWDYGLLGEPNRSETTFAIYGSGRGHLIDTLEIDGGLRLEHVSASARGAAAGIGWTSLEPRVSLHYARGPWSGALTARRYHPVLPLAMLSAGDPAAGYGRSFLWTDPNGDRLAQQGELGALVSLAGPGNPAPGFSTIAPNLKRPYVDELYAGIDVRIKPRVFLRFNGISRRGAALLARYNTGVPFEAYTVTKVFDPGLNLGGSEDDQMLPIYSRPPSTFGLDKYVLQNIPGVNSTYGGLYLAMLVERSPRWHLLVAATALHSYAPAAFRGHAPSENDEMLIGDSYSDPNSNTYSEGRTVFDRGYGLKVAAAYNARRRLTISAVGRYADGQNFARLVIAPDLPQGPDAIRAFANGKTKFTYTATLDLRVQKVLRWSGHDITLGVESYNTTNLRNEVEEDMVTGPRWRQPTFTQPPRVIRLTAGIAF
jgi:hypothetical protein